MWIGQYPKGHILGASMSWRERLERRMLDLGITRTELARRAGLNRTAVRDIIERGATPYQKQHTWIGIFPTFLLTSRKYPIIDLSSPAQLGCSLSAYPSTAVSPITALQAALVRWLRRRLRLRLRLITNHSPHAARGAFGSNDQRGVSGGRGWPNKPPRFRR